MKSIPSCARRSTSSASRSTSRSASPASPSMRSSTASPWPRRSRPSWRSSASSSARSPRPCRIIPTSCASTSARVVPYTDNFFATLNSAVFTDGSFCYIPKGVRCPMELSTYFRINTAGHGPVRADADHRRRRRDRQLSRRLHRADARRESASRRGRRTGRARSTRSIKYSTVQNWYPGDKERQGRHLQLRHQARQGVQGREDFLDAGGDRLGDHLEVSELHPAGRQLGRRVLFGRADESTTSRPTPARR